MSRTVKLTLEANATGLVAGLRSGAKAAGEARAKLLLVGQSLQDLAGKMGMSYDATGNLRDEFGRLVSEARAAELGLVSASAATKEFAAAQQYAADKTSAATSKFGQLAAWRAKNEKSLDTLANAAGKSGLAIAGGLALAGKAAMDWESSWTGVLKTVEGTPAQLGKVEDGLRGLAKTLPSSHAEIAAVAEAAGQLGVKTDDVVSFTKVMIDLGQSTNLSAEEAATSLARFSNVMGTSTDDVGKLGATLVGLGNNYATTESEIMAMSMRLAGAGKQIGLSEGQTMGLAAAMSSVGIEAEAGGSAMSLTMKRVGKAVDEGGQSLDTFASISGMTAEQFATTWKNDAAGGLEAFVLGLGEAGASGESVNAILTELGITGIRESDALLRLSSAGELMGSSMKAGANEYADGSALIEEATKRYETAESKVKIAWNNIKDAAITAGAAMLPIIASLADGVADLANWFGSLPKPVLNFLTALAGITGGGLLAVAGLVKMAKSTAELSTAMTAIYGTGGRATKAIGTFGKVLSGAAKAAGVAAIGFVALNLAIAAHNSNAPDAKKLEDFTQALLGVKDGTRSVDEAFKSMDFGNSSAMEGRINNVGDALKKLAPATGDIRGHLQSFGATALKVENGLPALKRELEGMSDAMAVAVQAGDGDAAAKMFTQMAESAKAGGSEIGDLLPYMDSYTGALKEAANTAGVTVNEQELLAWALSGVAPAAVTAAQAVAGVGTAGHNASSGADAAEVSIRGVAMSAEDAEDAVKNFYDALVAIGAVTLTERDALRGYEEAIDAAAEAATKNGKTLETNTEKGRANEAALDAIAAKTLSVVTAQEQNGRSAGELAATMEAGREAFIKQAVAMGMNADKAAVLADELNLIPDAVFMEFETNTEGVTARVSELYEWIKAAPDGKIQIDDNSPEVRATLEKLGFVVKDLPNGQIEVTEKGADKTGKKLDDVARKKRDAEIKAIGITKAAEDALNHAARDRTSLISTTMHTKFTSSGSSAVHRGGSGGQLDHWQGGRVGSYENGGRLPYTGLGRDMILGVGSDGRPTANVDDGEWVINERSSSKHDALLAMINRNDPRVDQMKALVGLASGGRVGAAESKVKSTRRAYDLIDGKRTNRLRKLAAKDQWEAAKAELAAAKKSGKASEAARKKAEDARKKAAEEEKARQGRLSDSRRELRTDLRRGNITDAFTSGSGMGQVDKLLEGSRNKDYSMGKRRGLARDAKALEKALTALTGKSEKLKEALEAAKEQADELRSVRDSVAGSLRGEFSLSGMLGESRKDLGAQPFTAKGISGKANAMAKRIEIFAGRLDRLRKMGYGETIIQEVAGLGTEDGITVAGVLMRATKGEKSSIVSAYKRLDTASGKAGQYVTESMYKGGLDAADGLVRGLEAKTKHVENAFYKLGKSGEKAFRRSLDMHSPSRVMFQGGVDAGEGAELGILSKVSDVQGAMGLMAEAPAFSVPPSAEVARYAAQPAAQPVMVFEPDYDKLAQAMANVQIPVRIGNKDIAQANTAGRKELRWPPVSPRG